MKNNTKYIKIRGKIIFYYLKEFFSYLYKQNIDYAIVKGEALSLYCYNELGRRASNDIDILVGKENIDKINFFLTKNKYYQLKNNNELAERADIISGVLNSHQTVPYKKTIQPYGLNIELDINFSFFWGEYEGKVLDIKNILTNIIEKEIYGQKVKILTPEYGFIQLILHHYKDCNSIYIISTRNSINLEMFEEVYLFWKNFKNIITIKWLVDYCIENNLLIYAYYILYYTNYLYKDEELCVYVEALKTADGIKNLDLYGLTVKEKKRWRVSFMERLLEPNLFSLIYDDLTSEDLKKINYNKNLF